MSRALLFGKKKIQVQEGLNYVTHFTIVKGLGAQAPDKCIQDDAYYGPTVCKIRQMTYLHFLACKMG